MGRYKHYLGFLLFTLLIFISANCTKSSKSSTSSGTILKVINIGGNTGIMPSLLPDAITYNNGDGSIWIVAANSSPSTINYVVKFDLKGNFITYTAVGHGTTNLVSDKQGNVWVSVANEDKVMELDPNGKIINQFNVGTRPWYINTDPAGNIWTLNIGPTCSGTCNGPPYVASFTEITTNGDVITGFSFSTPFAGPFIFDQSGNIWVTNDDAILPIIEMNITGTVIKSFPASNPVSFDSNFGSNMTFDHSENLWVLNTFTNKTGNMITKVYTTINKQSENYTMEGNYPWSIAVDNNDNIWVTGIYSNSVTKMSNSGKVIGVYRFDQFPQLFYYSGPESITVDKNNNIWFTDNRGDGYLIKLAP